METRALVLLRRGVGAWERLVLLCTPQIRRHRSDLAAQRPRDLTSTWPRVVTVNHESLRRSGPNSRIQLGPAKGGPAFKTKIVFQWPSRSSVAKFRAVSFQRTLLLLSFQSARVFNAT
eukprot:6097014-Pleurochrysis_carterae.AAC.2